MQNTALIMKCFAFSKILLRYLRFLFHFEFPYFFNTYYIFWQNSILFQGLGNQFWNSILLIPRGSPVCCTWYYISRQVRRTIGSTLQRESKCDCSENYICLKKPNQLKAEAEHRRPATNSPPPRSCDGAGAGNSEFEQVVFHITLPLSRRNCWATLRLIVTSRSQSIRRATRERPASRVL